MTRHIVLFAVLAACAPKSNRADSVDAALPAIDTLKPVTTSDTLVTATDSVTTRNPGRRDSAFSPPRNLPQLDTAKKKP
jgi:hypothetical protein